MRSQHRTNYRSNNDRNDRNERRQLDPRQMRYQVIGRTTDEADLIVQISPAFYEYVRSMAHQGVKAPRVESEDKPSYGKFAHPFHKDPIYSKDRGTQERRGGRLEQPLAPKKKPQSERYDEDASMNDIDAEMDEEYQMIKQGFANLNNKRPSGNSDRRSSSDRRSTGDRRPSTERRSSSVGQGGRTRR